MIRSLIMKLHSELNSVYVKLILVLFAVLIPLMGLLIGSSNYAIHIIRQQVSDAYQRQTAFYTNVIDQALSDAELYLSNIIVNNSDFEILRSSAGNADIYQLAYLRFNNNVSKDLSLYPLVDTFFYYDAEKDYYSTISNTIDSYETKTNEQYYIKENTVSMPSDDFKAAIHWQPVTMVGEPYLLRVLTSGKLSIGIWIRLSKILENYELSGTGSDAISAYFNAEGTPLISSSELPFPELDAASLSEGYIVIARGSRYTIVGESSDSGDFSLVSIIPDSIILNRLPVLSKVFRALSFALLLIIPLSVLQLHRVFRKPFSVMTSSMKKIQNGDLEERIRTDAMSKEFFTVSSIFNEMMDDIHDLKIKLYEDEINRQNEELVYLQMQVKPHFYLNSLNMIYTFARKNDISLISDLSMSLIRYFRYIFNMNTFAALSEELEHIKNYLRIQELRYPDSFRYEIEIEESLKNTLAPYLLIQNFVENSIKYAVTLDEKTELKIRIHPVSKSSDFFTIVIEDNGPGFSEDTLNKIQSGEIITDQERRHLGIWNCCRRIHLLYRDLAKVEFTNIQPHGALVRITLPVDVPELVNEKGIREGGAYEPANS